MKMEQVQKELQRWGEVMITTEAGEMYELHLGDVNFDNEDRVIRFKTGDEEYIIPGDAISTMKVHSSHKMG